MCPQLGHDPSPRQHPLNFPITTPTPSNLNSFVTQPREEPRIASSGSSLNCALEGLTKAKRPSGQKHTCGPEMLHVLLNGNCTHVRTHVHTSRARGYKASLEQQHPSSGPHTPITLPSRAGPGHRPQRGPSLPRLWLHQASYPRPHTCFLLPVSPAPRPMSPCPSPPAHSGQGLARVQPGEICRARGEGGCGREIPPCLQMARRPGDGLNDLGAPGWKGWG